MPALWVSLHLPGLTANFVDVEFLVDTGATDTYLHPLDALVKARLDSAMLLDSSRWRGRQVTDGIGGPATYYVHEAMYVFHHDDGSEQHLTRDIQIARPTPTNTRLPSLLGIDILRHFVVTMDYASQRLLLE